MLCVCNFIELKEKNGLHNRYNAIIYLDQIDKNDLIIIICWVTNNLKIKIPL